MYGVRINTIDYTKKWMSGNSLTWDSYRWCRPVAGEYQIEFGRQEIEIFLEIVTSESDIYTFWSSVYGILDDSLGDLVTITKGADLCGSMSCSLLIKLERGVK